MLSKAKPPGWAAIFLLYDLNDQIRGKYQHHHQADQH